MSEIIDSKSLATLHSSLAWQSDFAKHVETFYVPLSTYIEELLHHESHLVSEGKLSKDIILNSFPDFVKKNPKDAIVFSGGRLFRLKKITPAVSELNDYLIALEHNKTERNDVLMPPTFVAKRLDVLPVPEAFKRARAWHEYVEQQREKVTEEQAIALVKTLKKDHDFKVLKQFDDGNQMVKLLTAKAASAEGDIMKHCVASYGHDIETGKTTIYSLRNTQMLPVATIEMRGKKAVQVKGPHNSTIKPAYHEDLRTFFRENKITVGPDAKNFGGMGKSAENTDGYE